MCGSLWFLNLIGKRANEDILLRSAHIPKMIDDSPAPIEETRMVQGEGIWSGQIQGEESVLRRPIRIQASLSLRLRPSTDPPSEKTEPSTSELMQVRLAFR